MSSASTAVPVPAGPVSVRRGIADRWRDLGRPPRLIGLDVARALAVVGMVAVHVGRVPELTWSRPATWGGISHGHSALLFAFVAGISVALSTGRRDVPAGDRLRTARLALVGRALVVLAIGLVLELLGSPASVILPVYGVLFVALTPVLGWTPRRLAVAAVTVALVGPALVTGATTLALGGAGGPGISLLVVGVYQATTWLPLLLAGMALGRCELGSPRFAAGLLVGGVLLAVLGHGLGAAVGTGAVSAGEDLPASESFAMDAQGRVVGEDGDAQEESPGALPSYRERLLEDTDLGTLTAAALSSAPHSGGTLEIVGGGGVAAAVVGACLLLGRPLRPVLVPLAAVGSMPLTCYAVHVVSLAVLIAPGGLLMPLLADDGRPTGHGTFLWSVAVALVGCTAWALTLGRGPLERLTARGARALAR